MAKNIIPLGASLFLGVLVCAPGAAQAQETPAPSRDTYTQPSRQTPSLRKAPTRKPNPAQAEKLERFLQENGDQIRAAQMAGKGC